MHSFSLFLQRLFKSTTTKRRSRHITDTVPEFHAEAPHATVSEGVAQAPFVAARAGVEPMTLLMKGIDSTKAPSRPMLLITCINYGPNLLHLFCAQFQILLNKLLSSTRKES